MNASPTSVTVPSTWLVDLVDRLDEIGLPVAVRAADGGTVAANDSDRDLFGTDGGPWADPADEQTTPAETGVAYVTCSISGESPTHVVRIVLDVDKAVGPAVRPSIDASRLDALASQLSADIVDDLLSTFLTALDDRVAAIETGRAGDAARAADVLRTASLLVGATGLADECARIERGCEPGNALRREAAAARALSEWWRTSRATH